MNERESDEWNCLMPFWIDTEAYSDRDRLMFVAGVEFEMVSRLLEEGWTGTRPIHRENESRVRMMAAKMKIPGVHIRQHEGYEGCETWSDLEVLQ